MQYMIMAFEDQAAFDAREDPARAGEYWASWTGYIAAHEQSGVLTSAGAALFVSTQPAGSTTAFAGRPNARSHTSSSSARRSAPRTTGR